MTTSTQPHPIPAPEGMTGLEKQFRSKANGDLVTQRLYQRADGLALGARRGGPLHLADADTWEIFTMCNGIVYGEPVGWVTEERLQSAIARLAAWGQEAAS